MANINQEFDSTEVQALESWMNQRMASHIGSGQRGTPARSNRGRYLDRVMERRADQERRADLAKRFGRIANRARGGVEMPVASQAMASIKAGAKAVSRTAVSAAGLIPSGPTSLAAIALAAVALTIEERMSSVEGSLESLARTRGRSHKALQNPFMSGRLLPLEQYHKFGVMGTAVHAKDFISGWVSGTWSFLGAVASGNEFNNGIPHQRFMQAWYSFYKGEPPHVARWNNLERRRFDEQINRGETEFLGWRKTPERIGG